MTDAQIHETLLEKLSAEKHFRPKYTYTLVTLISIYIDLNRNNVTPDDLNQFISDNIPHKFLEEYLEVAINGKTPLQVISEYVKANINQIGEG